MTEAPRDEQPPVLRLTRLQFWSILGVALAIFLFSTGPVWRKPWDMGPLNWAILYSYAPLPFLVIGGLAYKRRLGLRAFFLDTLALTLLKYSLTFSIALGLWLVAPRPPAPAPEVREPHPPAPAEAAPSPTPIAPEQTGDVSGVVVDPAGKPVEGALAYVAAGLESYVFAAPATEVVLENDGTGLSPALAAVQLRQPIFARSTDGHLHTFVATKDGVTALNSPLLGSGLRTPLLFKEAHGVMDVRCSVHQHLGTERHSALAVFAHPFFAMTGAEGRFALHGVPAGGLRMAAWDRRGEGTAELQLEPRGSREVKLTLVAARAPAGATGEPQ